MNRVTFKTNELSDGRSFTYDAAGRVQSVEETSPANVTLSQSTYVYDALDRLTSETIDNAGMPEVVLTSDYGTRPDGLRTSLSATIGGVADFQNSYTYDTLLRMTDVTQQGVTGGNAVADKHVSLTFDADGRTEYIRRYASTGTGDLVAASHYTYDAIGRLTALTHYHSNETTDVLAGYTWTFDAAGRLTQFVNSTDGTRNYTYDATGQLTLVTDGNSATLESYSYDENGNRTSANGNTNTSGANNHLISDGTYTYQYDAEGNRVARWVASTSNETAPGTGDTDITVYTWDNRNRLTKVTHFATFANYSNTTSVPDQVVDYIYDVFNRRIASIYDTNGDGTPDRIERYIWDGQNVVLDFVDPDGGNNGGSSAPLALATRYLTGSAVGQVFAQEAAGDGSAANVLWMLPDNEGSNRDLARYDDGDTSVVTHYVIDSYGNATATVGSLYDTRYIWAQTQYDGVTGEYYALARWMDPQTGGWLSEDPIGFQGGDANIGRYCGNDPGNGVDPSGLVIAVRQPEKLGGGVHSSLTETYTPLPESLIMDPLIVRVYGPMLESMVATILRESYGLKIGKVADCEVRDGNVKFQLVKFSWTKPGDPTYDPGSTEWQRPIGVQAYWVAGQPGQEIYVKKPNSSSSLFTYYPGSVIDTKTNQKYINNGTQKLSVGRSQVSGRLVWVGKNAACKTTTTYWVDINDFLVDHILKLDEAKINLGVAMSLAAQLDLFEKQQTQDGHLVVRWVTGAPEYRNGSPTGNQVPFTPEMPWRGAPGQQPTYPVGDFGLFTPSGPPPSQGLTETHLKVGIFDWLW
jgi:RHS repeat-associated protein